MRKVEFSKTWKTSIATLSVATLGLGLLTGCGEAKGSTSDAATTAAEAEEAEETTAADTDNTEASDAASETEVADDSTGEVKKVLVGSGIAYHPYAFLDDNGDAVGYDYDVLKAIDEYLTDYEFEYESMNFDNILLSLDADKIDVAAHEYEYTDERAEKYLFTEEFYSEFITRIAIPSDNTEINSIEDLAGKKVEAGGTTSATYTLLSAWNEEHPGQEIDIVSTDGTNYETTAANLKNGVWDAAIIEQKDIVPLNQAAGDENFAKLVGDPINESHGYFLFNKDDTELQQAFDEAIKALKENGKLDEIANEWLSDLEQ